VSGSKWEVLVHVAGGDQHALNEDHDGGDPSYAAKPEN
jgi:hypothetical protein